MKLPSLNRGCFTAAMATTKSAWGFRAAVLIMTLMALFTGQGFCSEDEERLVRDLFRGYNKLVRPVKNMSMKVDVKFGLTFTQLISVNEKNQVMKSNVWLRLTWQDYQLQWDVADYGGINVLRLPPDRVWKPDIVLFNNADGNYEVRYKCNVLIYSGGEVLWVPPAIYQSSCTIDVTYFPFDQQTCLLKFGSWTFNGDQVSLDFYLDKHHVDLSDYWKSGTWDIIEVPGKRNVHNHTKPTQMDITFSITIRRKTLFYTVNLILPTVLISFLCVLVFYLPAEAGEKVTLGISILLSLVVFLLLVSKILPPTSLVLPLIAKYLLFTFIMNTLSILVTVVIINWNFRGPRTHRMPNWIRVVFLKYLPILLLMKRPKKTRLRWMMEPPAGGYGSYGNFGGGATAASTTSMGMSMSMAGGMSTSSSGMGQPPPPPPPPPPLLPYPSAGGASGKMEVMELADLHHPDCRMSRQNSEQLREREREHHDPHCCERMHAISSNEELMNLNERPAAVSGREMLEPPETLLLTPEAYKATEAVEFIAEHLRNEDEYTQIREDWKYVAMVIDRLQLYVFFAVTTAGTIGILINAPHIFEYVDQDKVVQMYRWETG
ncbi:CHRNA7-FAM7A fusion protein [Daphnia magna]|uniref:CHRNA7-FAM7A fusion protein n=1 Tax=Daphnia magna TaxID=35525 RepID=A0A0P5CY77_9CRUS|nr:CHRNA7-FAM7A fusion protein [Daphnia magna]